jgi:hypothetical protein
MIRIAAVDFGPSVDLLRVIAQCPKWGSFDDPCEAGYALSSRIA